MSPQTLIGSRRSFHGTEDADWSEARFYHKLFIFKAAGSMAFIYMVRMHDILECGRPRKLKVLEKTKAMGFVVYNVFVIVLLTPTIRHSVSLSRMSLNVNWVLNVSRSYSIQYIQTRAIDSSALQYFILRTRFPKANSSL